tara:strand:+ start:543 stop:1736 length:1194 start_codon:yes stop_codon:yes gene_type:complete
MGEDGECLRDDLFGEDVERVIDRILDSASVLSVAETLRSQFDGELARRIATLRELRLRAKRRFGEDVPPFLTASGLEQATHPRLASRRSDEIHSQIGQSRIWDATCGIGVDGRALARGGSQVVLGDLDPETLSFALENMRRAGHRGWAVRADARTRAVQADVVLLDPDRRAAGKRSLDPEAWSPTLSESLEIAERFDGACLKLAPGLDPLLLPDLPTDWVSVDGSLTEVTVWAGSLAVRESNLRRVLALKSDGTEVRFEGRPTTIDAWEPEDAANVTWLAVPDPGLLRSDLLATLAEQEGLRPLAPQLAWLGGTHAPTSPLLRGHTVLGSAPLDRKKVRALLGEYDVGAVTVLKRGHPDLAEVLARRFRGPGSKPGLLAVGRLERGHRAWLIGPAAV